MPDISSSLSKREVNARQNTYTKSEIDLKDGAIQAIAEAAQTTADAAEKKNQEQDQLIAELQKSAHTHSNQDVLDKTEQPYTTAERDKLAGLENYTHPTYTAHAKGFYKFANDGKGHVADTEKVTKEDIVGLGIPSANTTYKITRSNNLIRLEGSDGSLSAAMTNDYVVHGAESGTDVDPYKCYLIFYSRKPEDDAAQVPYLRSSEAIWVDKYHSGICVKGTVTAGSFSGANATTAKQGLMSSEDKKKLDGIAAGATKVAVDSALSATSTNPVQNKAVKAALDSKSASDHTHAMITNSAMWIAGANNTAKWVKLGTLVSSGNFSNGVIRVWTGDGANGRANQNSSFEIQIKDGWQSTLSADKACGVTVYRISCSDVKVKVIPTAHDTYTVWAYMPWGYWNGNYAVYGKYKSWTSQHLIQSGEPEGTGANTAYYDQAFLTSTVAAAKTLTDSGWVDVSNFKVDISSFSQITTSFRKYGDIVFIRGRVQPKSNMTSISLCSTTSTSLTGITPNHSVKGVGVSTDGLTPFMVNITTSPANSVILKGSFSANKIYDFEFSYIK